MRPPASALALAALLTTVVLWGSAYVAIRVALDGFGPAGLTAGRVVVGATALAAAAPAIGIRRPALGDLPRIALCGVVGITGYQFLINAGERTVPAGTTSLLVNMAPLFTVLLAWLLLHDRLGPRARIGIALGFLGATVMALGEGEGLGLSRNALLIVVAAASFALFIVLQKPLLTRYTGFELTCYTMWAGAVIATPLLPALAGDVRSASEGPVLAVLFLGLGPSAIGFATWSYALARFEISTTATALYLLPIVAITMGWLILGEQPHPVALLGGAIVLAGIILSRTRSRRAVEPLPADQSA